jgi:hypothetical protein
VVVVVVVVILYIYVCICLYIESSRAVTIEVVLGKVAHCSGVAQLCGQFEEPGGGFNR